MSTLALRLGRFLMTAPVAPSPAELDLLHRRLVQVGAIVAAIVGIAGFGIATGKLLQMLDTINTTMVEVRADVRASAQASSRVQFQVEALERRVEILERSRLTPDPRP